MPWKQEKGLADVALAHTNTKAFAYNSSKPVHFIGKFRALVQTKKLISIGTSAISEHSTNMKIKVLLKLHFRKVQLWVIS